MNIDDFTKEDTKDTKSPFPDCSLFHNKFSHCLEPNTQINHIFKHGEAENCGEFVHDWRKCMSAKFTKDEAKVKV
jgi:hypothetical protein